MNVSSERVRIGVLPVETWSPPSAEDATFRYVDISSVDRDSKSIVGVTELPVRNAPSRARQILRAHDVLVSTVRPNLNAVAIVPEALDGAIGSTGFTVLRSNSKRLLPRFLFHWVRSPAFIADMTKKATGASYPAISDRIVLESDMPMPDVDEQRRIADVLDKAEAIRRKRKEAIALTEELLRSAFLEMFGDPVTNPKGWRLQPLCQFGHITTGNTPSRAVPEFFGDDIDWIKSDNINTPGHFLTKATEGLSAAGKAVGRTAQAGSTLMTCIAGSPDCIGNVALANREVAFNQQINAITPFEGVDHRYLYVLLLVGKPLVQAAATNSMKGMVSKGRLEGVRMPSSPPDLQIEFGKTFERVLQMSGEQEAAHSESERLFQALLHQSFGQSGTTRTA